MAQELVAVRKSDEESLLQVRDLFLEYADSLDFDLGFQDFDRELAELPGEYSEPDGRLFIAYESGKPAGCVALRKIDEGICEMKRLYVRPEFRGRAIGRVLAERVVSVAKKLGYGKMRLDTVSSMTEAITLYRSLGFVEIGKYRLNPLPGALFLELDLTTR
ncbi:MAG TPA: GNAT family N-acetyltransferase [Candidatus Kryptobacter bacterium]|nr:GNAT family N-acetyltransferase [Candidatus Kryptobacter bacterium]